mmetsp:Transcript_33/g.92  ORF Transcript_33/g.92 Transcript_33/m.92 type:complete len:196 (+) Transcript_33:1-588(+)
MTTTSNIRESATGEESLIEKNSCPSSSSSNKKDRTRVQFSPMVAIHTYQEEADYATSKSFNSTDLQRFKVQVLATSRRIDHELKKASPEYEAACQNPHTKLFVLSPSLLERIDMDPEELIGIEHFLNDASPALAIMSQKNEMMEAILGEQRFQRIMWKLPVDDSKMAETSEMYSKSAVTRAWRKAAYVEALCERY